MNLNYVKKHLSNDYRLKNVDKLCLENTIDPQKTDLELHCIEHGIDFTAKWRRVRNGYGCFICDGGVSVEMIMGSKLANITGRPIEYAGETRDLKARIKKSQPIAIICTVCRYGDVDSGKNSWIRPISQITISSSYGGHGCPQCFHDRNAKEQQLSPASFHKKLFKAHGNKYTFDRDTYKGASKKCLFTHVHDSCGVQFEMRAQRMLDPRSSPCPACHGDKVLDKVSTDVQLDKIIRKRSEGKYKLAIRSKSDYSIRCNRCNSPDTYVRQLSGIGEIEHCSTCFDNRPFKSRSFKEHEAVEILKRRNLRVAKKQRISSYKKPYRLYDIKTGKMKIPGTSIYALLKNDAKSSLNIVPYKKGLRWTDSDIRLLLEYAKENYSNQNIACLLGRTRSSIEGRIFSLRKEGYVVEYKNTKNESFFSIPTIENCYIAGLLASDGWITDAPSRVRITLKAIDELVLENICIAADICQPNGKIKEISYGMSKGYDAVYATLTIGKAERWIKDLEKIFSITKNKSNSIEPPAMFLTKSQTLGYIAGQIEGDGSVSKSGVINWCSNSVALADWFCNAIEDITGKVPNRNQTKIKANGTGGLHVVYLSKQSSAILYEKIMKLRVTKMDRKWSRML